MELIDDWYNDDDELKEVASTNGQARRPHPDPALPKKIGARMLAFAPDLLYVHCYRDVRYPWVQAVFKTTVTPELALRVGSALAEVAGADNVYFNSLRPQAVYFVLTPAFEQEPTLNASRYGTRLADIQAAWHPE